jgi:chlorobactene glucosyltransferase
LTRWLITAGFGAWANLIGVWLWLLILQVCGRRQGLFLQLEAGKGGQDAERDWPAVRAIVPVRNVGDRARPCLESILGQDYPALTLTVVDDRSEDDTARHVARAVGRDERVRLLRIDSLPAGWLGKSHALWTASSLGDEEWLLFLDDDCLLAPGAVRAAVNYARAQSLDLLTLWPRHLARTFWEHMIIPLCGGIIALWFGSPRVNDPQSRTAFANGQFLLVRRDAYARIGGHACVRDAIIEDVPLAEQAKRGRLRCGVASGAELFGVRMYDRYAAICDGWSRIYVGALRSGLKISLSMLWLCFGSLWPFLVTPAAVGHLLAAGGPPDWRSPVTWAAVMGLLHAALIAVVSYRFWGYGHCRRVYLWLYPLSVLIVLRILAGAWWQLLIRRRVRWRNTSYAIDRAGRIVAPAPP